MVWEVCYSGLLLSMCEIGKVGQMISELKLPLNGSKRRFSVVSLHLTVLYPTPPTLRNMYILEQLWKALLGVGSQRKELEIQKNTMYTHLYVFSWLCSPPREPPRAFWIKDNSVNTSHMPMNPPLLHKPSRER